MDLNKRANRGILRDLVGPGRHKVPRMWCQFFSLSLFIHHRPSGKELFFEHVPLLTYAQAFIWSRIALQLAKLLPLSSSFPSDHCRVWFGDSKLWGEVTKVPWTEFGGAAAWPHQLQLPLWAGGPGMGYGVNVLIKRSAQRSVALFAPNFHCSLQWKLL